MLREIGLVSLLLTPLGCMTTTTRYVTRGTGQQELLMESGQGLPSIMGDFQAEPGLVRGHVGWTSDCRRAIVRQQITEEVKVDKPNNSAAIAATAIGAGVGAIAMGMLSSADQFSDEKTCSTDSQGGYSCSSPRDNAIGFGVVGVITSVALMTTGAVTFASQPTSHVMSSQPAPSIVSRVTQEHVACGDHPVQGLGLSLLRAGVGVAASSTNANGDVAFAVPPTITGGLVVVVDSVPPPLANIRVGDVIGAVELRPNVGQTTTTAAESGNAADSQAPTPD